MLIAENLAQIIKKMNDAVQVASIARINKSNHVKLVAVTKNHDVLAMEQAIAAGVLTIGENRVQEALGKSLALTSKVEWQLIGHLQTNKVRQAVSLFDLIQSVDSEKLAREIDQAAGKIGKKQDVLLQINVAKEDSKFGIDAKDCMTFAHMISELDNVRLCGLMTVAPFYEDPELSRPIFRKMYELFMELQAEKIANTKIEWLSMGMTHDYKIAIEEGSNLVRIGTGIFGQRQY